MCFSITREVRIINCARSATRSYSFKLELQLKLLQKTLLVLARVTEKKCELFLPVQIHSRPATNLTCGMYVHMCFNIF